MGVSPRTHGSGLFTRGQTQILTLCTLGTAKEGQRIDDLSLDLQPKLLRALEDREFRRVGSSQAGIKFDTRVIAASKKDLWNEVQDPGSTGSSYRGGTVTRTFFPRRSAS